MKKVGTLSREDEILTGLLEVCQIYRTPMFVSVSKKPDELSAYNNIVYSAQSHIIRLFHDNIRRHMLIANGFETLPARGVTDAEVLNMRGRKPTVYECDAYQKEEIAKRMDAVYDYAKEMGMYFFASVAVSNTDGRTEYMYRWHLPEKDGVHGVSQIIRRHLRIEEDGCDAVPERENISIDLSEVIG